MRLHCGIYGKRVQSVHRGIVDGTDDPCRADDIPRGARVLAVLVQEVFLRIVEVGLDGHARVRLRKRCACDAKMDSIVLCTSLKNEPSWFDIGQRHSFEEVAQKGS